MTRFRASAGATCLSAAAVTAAAVHHGGSPWWVLGVLRRLDEHGYALWYAWVLAAPLVLLAAATVVRRTPWPWTAAVVAHLASVVAAAARVHHWLPGWSWAVVLVVVCCGLWSVAEALNRRG